MEVDKFNLVMKELSNYKYQLAYNICCRNCRENQVKINNNLHHYLSKITEDRTPYEIKIRLTENVWEHSWMYGGNGKDAYYIDERREQCKRWTLLNAYNNIVLQK